MSNKHGPDSKKQLMTGRIRKLSVSELGRGNMFLSKANNRIDFIDNDIIIVFDGHEFPKQKIDAYGRIFIGKYFLKEYKNKLIELKLASRSKLFVKVIEKFPSS